MKKFKSLGVACLSSLTFFMAIEPSYALGLGSIQLESYLNEPLKAHIPIKSTHEIALSEIRVKLASQEDFEKAGIERPFYLTKLNYDLVDKDGQAYIEVTSHQPIKNPFVSFILEANWASGKVQREYTVLLDPVQMKPKANWHRPSKVSTSVKPHPSSSQSKRSFTQDGEQYGPVRAHDTLWDIAHSVAKPYDADIYQTMMAIARKNPDAFIHGNVNGLKRGATLALPTEDEIFELSSSEAIARSAQHEKAWRTGQPFEPLEPLRTRAEAELIQKPLILVMPEVVQESETSESSLQSASDWEPSVTEPSAPEPIEHIQAQNTQQRLLMIEETLDALMQTNDNLQQQQTLLQEQNSQLMAVLAQKDQQIEQLTQSLALMTLQQTQNSLNQRQLIEDQMITDNASTASLEAKTLGSPSNPEPKAALQGSSDPQSTNFNPSTAHQPQPVLPPVESQAPEFKQEGISLWWFVVLGLAGFSLAGVGYEVYRRRFIDKHQAFSLDDELEPLKVETPQEEDIPDSLNKDEIDDALSLFGDEVNEANQVAEQQASLFVKGDSNSEQPGSVMVSEYDAIAEAESCLSLKKYDEAEALLKDHLADNPDDASAHLILLELYDETDNVKGLQDHIQTIPKNIVDTHPVIAQMIQQLTGQSSPHQPAQAHQEPPIVSAQMDNKEQVSHELESKDEKSTEPSVQKSDEPQLEDDQESADDKLLEYSLKQTTTQPKESPETKDEAASFDLGKNYDLSLESTESTSDASQVDQSPNVDNSQSQQIEEDDPLEQEFKGEDEMTTKIALAQAYLDLGDKEGALEHLKEIVKHGNLDQQAKAQEMIKSIDG